MAIKNTELGGTDWTTGEALVFTDINDTFNACRRVVAQVYTGTGFNSSQFNSGTDEQDHEMDAITAANLSGGTYLKISVTARFHARGFSPAVPQSGYVQLKIQTKEVGGSYADSLAYKKILECIGRNSSSEVTDITSCISFVYYHTLTAGEKTNGVQAKIFSSSTSQGSLSGGSATNVQTFIEVV